MNHHDADISDIVIILHDEMDISLADAVSKLRALGVVIDKTDEENGAVEATMESVHLKVIEQLPFVKYVRRVFEYTADFPVGDPRNLDPDNEDSEGDVDDAGA